MVWNIPLLSWVQLPWLCPLQLPVHPHPAGWWGRSRSRKGLDPVQALLSSKESTSVVSTLFLAQVQNTAPTSYCEENYPYSSPNQHFILNFYSFKICLLVPIFLSFIAVKNLAPPQ